MVTCLFSLLSLCVTGCNSVSERRQAKAAAFAQLSPADQERVRRGQIVSGMDTNAVYVALGKPSAVVSSPSPSGAASDEVWLYYGNRPVLVPAWVYLPDQYGYWELQYSPEHYSVRYTRTEVRFREGRVVDSIRQ